MPLPLSLLSRPGNKKGAEEVKEYYIAWHLHFPIYRGVNSEGTGSNLMHAP